MASGVLKKIDEFSVTSEIASVTIGGGSNASSGTNAVIDNSYNVYMFTFNDVVCATDDKNLLFQLNKASDNSIDSTSNYDSSGAIMTDNSGTLTAFYGANQAAPTFASSQGTGTGEAAAGTFYLFQFSESAQYSFWTVDTVYVDKTPNQRSYTGGAKQSVEQATNGITMTWEDNANFADGHFVLYGLDS